MNVTKRDVALYRGFRVMYRMHIFM